MSTTTASAINKSALRSHVLKSLMILVALLGLVSPGKSQTTSITATFKTPGGQTPAAANLKPITTINGTPVYGTAEFDPYDLNGNRSTRIVCGGITFLPQSVRGWIRGDGALVDSSALVTSIALVPTKNCQPANLVYRAVYSLNGSTDNRISALSWTEFKEIPQMALVDWAQLSQVNQSKAAFSYIQQNGGVVLDYLDFNNTNSIIPPNPPAGYCRAYFDTVTLKLHGVTSTGTDCNPGGAGSLASLNGLTGSSQTFANTNDANVTLGISSSGAAHTFALGWTGTLAKNRQNATTVYTDQPNAFSAGAQDFSAATSLKVVLGPALAPTVSGLVAYDSTNNKFVFGQNGAAVSFGLSSSACSANQFVNTPATGVAGALCAQPTLAGLSGVANVVQNNQANIYSTGAQNFSAASSLLLPSAAGFSTTSAGGIGYDSTNKNLHIGANGVDNINLVIPSSVSVVNSDCAKYSLISGVLTLTTAGGPCSVPAGTSGQLQLTTGTALAASGESDDSTTFSTTRVFKATKDAIHCGPNPWFDVRCFGASGKGATTTGSITSGTPTLTLASAQDFVNGEGIVIYKAGALPSLSIPGTPIVTPLLANGATTWNYQVIAEDRAGGLTAASATGTTTTGAAGLGYTTVAVTTVTRTSGISTYTTSSAHNLTAGMTVQICGFSSQTAACGGAGGTEIFNGAKVVQSVPSGTTFTTIDGNVGDNSQTISATVNFLSCNTLTFPNASYSGSQTLRYWIYRSQGAGAFSLVGLAEGIDPYFVDCGASHSITQPAYVPTTPLVSPQAGYLSTTILSGGGTTTLTLAANAGTNATTQLTQHNDGLALLAAATAAAANANGGVVYIPDPNPSGFSIQIQALTDFNPISSSGNNIINLLVAGDMNIDQPLVLRTGMKIEGAGKRNTSFMYQGGAWLTGKGAPLLYIPFRSSIGLKNLFIQTTAGPYSSALYADSDNLGNGSNGIILDNVAFDGFNADGFAREMVLKGGFDYLMKDTVCTPGNIGSNTLPSPCFEFTNSSKAINNVSTQVPGRVIIERAFFNNAGISVNAAPNPGATPGDYNINGVLTEVMYQPFLSIRPGLDSAGRFYLTDIVSADQASGPGTPMIQTSGNKVNTVSISGGSLLQNQPVLITDQTVPGLLVLKMHVATTNYGYTNNPHVAFHDSFTDISGQPLFLNGTGRAQAPLFVIGAPSGCVVSAGGAVPVGGVTYLLTAIDALGNESLNGPGVFVTTTTGNQTVTCNVPALPSGAIGYGIYRNTGGNFQRTGGGSCVNGVPQVRIGSFVDNLAGLCGAALPTVSGSGSTILSSSGLSTFQLQTVSATGFIGTEVAPSLTAARTRNIPDATGTILLDATLPTTLTKEMITPFLAPAVANTFDNFGRANGGLGANWTSIFNNNGSLAIVGNTVKGGNAGAVTGSRWSATTFPNDHGAQMTVSGASNFIGVGVRYSGTTLATTQGYACMENATALTIFKVTTGGGFSSLATTAITAGTDVIRATVTGSSISCSSTSSTFVTTTITASDGTFTSGAPAIEIHDTTGVGANWIAFTPLYTGDHVLNGNLLTSVSGNSGRIAESLGVLVNGNLTKADANGNIVDSGISAISGATSLSGLTAASAANSINNVDNAQTWNWALTTAAKAGMKFTENTAATAGAGSQFIVQIATLLGSTAVPLNVANLLSGSQVLPAVSITPTWNTSALATAMLVNVTSTASAAGSLLADFQVAGASQFKIDKAGNATALTSVVTPSLVLNGHTLSSAGGNAAAVTTQSATLTNGKLVVGDANNNASPAGGAGTLGITFPGKLVITGALCNNATASPAFNLPTSSAPTANCNTGTNVQEGTLDFADANTAQYSLPLPSDWTGAIDARVVFFDSSTSGTVIWNIATACTTTNGSATDDTAFNTADAFGTVTVGSPASEVWEATKTGINTTGCSAGNKLAVKISRATDTAAGVARLSALELTVRRAL